MAAKQRRKKGYGFDPDFEREVTVLACTDPRFFGRVAVHLDPVMMGQPACELALTVAKAIAKDVGHGPSSQSTVLQRLRAMIEAGQIKREQRDEVVELFDRVDEEGGIGDVDEIATEIVPVLKKLLQKQAGAAVIDSRATGDLTQCKKLIEAAESLGTNEMTAGHKLTVATFEEIAALGKQERLSTGIEDLDQVLGGGIMRGEYWIFSAMTGGGKSFMLAQIAAESIFRGKSVAFATVGEINRQMQQARILANLTGGRTLDIVEGKAGGSLERFREMADSMGRFRIIWFESGTTVAQIRDWTKLIEDEDGAPVEVVCIDYLDELGGPMGKDGEYTMHKHIGNKLADWAQSKMNWVFSATQAKRRDNQGRKRRKIGTEDVAESHHKSKKCFGMVTINTVGDSEESPEEVSFFVAKNRTGVAKQSTDFLPTDWDHGRIVALRRREKWGPTGIVMNGGKG